MDFLVIFILFLIAADGVIGVHVLQMPIVSCTLIGLASGNAETAVQAGAMAQIVYMFVRNDGFESGILSALFYLSLQNGGNAAVSGAGAAAGVLAGAALEALIRMISTLFLPAARKSAEKRSDGGLGTIVVSTLVLRAVIVTAAGIVVMKTGSDAVAALESGYGWLLGGLVTASSFLRYLGAAVILRNLTLRDMTGAFWAGAAAAILFAAENAVYGLAVCAMFAFAAAAYDFHSRKNGNGSSTSMKGGAEKWW